MVVWWYDGLVVWWFGGLVVWWFGGLVVWWFGGLVVWWFGGLVVKIGHSTAPVLIDYSKYLCKSLSLMISLITVSVSKSSFVGWFWFVKIH